MVETDPEAGHRHAVTPAAALHHLNPAAFHSQHSKLHLHTTTPYQV